MKCSKNQKKIRGKCVKKHSIFSNPEKKFWGIELYISMIIFFIFSVVLFVNNLTGFFDSYGIKYQMNIITWIALVGSFLYTLWLKVFRDLIR